MQQQQLARMALLSLLSCCSGNGDSMTLLLSKLLWMVQPPFEQQFGVYEDVSMVAWVLAQARQEMRSRIAIFSFERLAWPLVPSRNLAKPVVPPESLLRGVVVVVPVAVAPDDGRHRLVYFEQIRRPLRDDLRCANAVANVATPDVPVREVVGTFGTLLARRLRHRLSQDRYPRHQEYDSKIGPRHRAIDPYELASSRFAC